MTHPTEGLRRIARLTAEEVAGYGLSRADLAALAQMPPEQVARMEGMARLHGCEPAQLDRDLQIAAALTCTDCAEQGRCREAVADPGPEAAFCPNAATFRLAGAG